MANEYVMWCIIWFCVLNDISPIRLISPIGTKTTIPLQIIEAGLFIIQCGLLKRGSKKRISSFSTQHLAFFRDPSSCGCP